MKKVFPAYLFLTFLQQTGEWLVFGLQLWGNSLSGNADIFFFFCALSCGIHKCVYLWFLLVSTSWKQIRRWVSRTDASDLGQKDNFCHVGLPLLGLRRFPEGTVVWGFFSTGIASVVALTWKQWESGAWEALQPWGCCEVPYRNHTSLYWLYWLSLLLTSVLCH